MNEVNKVPAIPMPDMVTEWSKDHWSLLAYIETRCVDYEGTLDIRHMRCNEARHPEFRHSYFVWDDRYSTRCKSGPIVGHDDWDVLKNLVRAELIYPLYDGKPEAHLTDKGKKMATAIRMHKIGGGTFANIYPKESEQ